MPINQTVFTYPTSEWANTPVEYTEWPVPNSFPNTLDGTAQKSSENNTSMDVMLSALPNSAKTLLAKRSNEPAAFRYKNKSPADPATIIKTVLPTTRFDIFPRFRSIKSGTNTPMAAMTTPVMEFDKGTISNTKKHTRYFLSCFPKYIQHNPQIIPVANPNKSTNTFANP